MNSNISRARQLAEVIGRIFNQHNVQVRSVYLFGSRSSSNSDSSSDWDFLVFISKALDRQKKREILTEIRTYLAFEYNIAADIIVRPASLINEILEDKNSVSYEGLVNGILVHE